MKIIVTLDHVIKVNGKYCKRNCQYYRAGSGMGNQWERCLLFDQPWLSIYSDRDGTLRCKQCLEATLDV